MDKPAAEIPFVIARLISSASPDVQTATVQKYFALNAGFQHFLAVVDPGERSRVKIHAIYRWYRVMSSYVDTEVSDIVFDEKKKLLFCDVTQHFHIRGSPFGPRVSRLHVKLRLHQRADGRYLIASQEDFFQPQAAASLVFPLLAPLFFILLRLTAFFCMFASTIASKLGVWSPEGNQRGRGGKLYVNGQLMGVM